VENRESKIILNRMILVAENEVQYALGPGLLRHNYSWVAVDQSMCSSILNLPPLLLQLEC